MTFLDTCVLVRVYAYAHIAKQESSTVFPAESPGERHVVPPEGHSFSASTTHFGVRILIQDISLRSFPTWFKGTAATLLVVHTRRHTHTHIPVHTCP